MPNQSGPMACPVDGATLVMSERSGIEIDYCPTCRGVWLDRGELDKIIERNAGGGGAPAGGAATRRSTAAAAGRRGVSSRRGSTATATATSPTSAASRSSKSCSTKLAAVGRKRFAPACGGRLVRAVTAGGKAHD